MTYRARVTIALFVVLGLRASWCSARTALSQTLFGPGPIPHPVALPLEGRSPSVWRHTLGDHGEYLVKQSLRSQGYELLDPKSGGNRGIDWIAVRRNGAGELIDAKFIEVKTHYGSGPRLGRTRSGQQMSRQWLAEHFRDMRRSPDPNVRHLTREIAQLRKARGVPIESFGELHDVNYALQRYSVQRTLTGTTLSTEPLDKVFARIRQQSPDRAVRRFARNHRRKLSQISATSMSGWLSQRNVTLRFPSRSARALAAAAKSAAASQATRRIIRLAGPVGAALAIAIDVSDAYRQFAGYRAGHVNFREFTVGLSSTVGGVAGAWAGAWGGVAFGTWVGSFGGPLAWITVPGGAIIGGVVGGIGGYVGGSAGGAVLAERWFQKIDDRVKSRVDLWILSSGVPAELLSPS